MQKLKYQKKHYLQLGEQPLSGSTLKNWIKLLIDNKFKIDWQFIPKSIYVTAMIIALSPFRYLERKKFDEKIKEKKDIKPIFIIGHFRSGTTFLHYLLGQDPQIGYVSTFETMTPGIIIDKEKFLKNLVKNHLPAKRPMDDLEMKVDLPYEEEYAIANLSQYSFYHGWYFPKKMKSYFDKYVTFKNISKNDIEKWKQVYDYFLKKINYKNEGKPILLKSIVNTARIKNILKLYPNAKFIHIHRNPYEVYMSSWRLYKKILPIFSFQHISSATLDKNILYCYKQLYKKYLSDKHLIPKENLIEIRFDKFIEKPLKTLLKIYQKFGFSDFNKAKPFFEKYIHKHRNYQSTRYKFSNSLKNKVFKEWRFIFEEYEYEK
ncbi:MAG: sulfotransferase [Candidatus Thermoplasmatota archaeon]